MTESQDALKDTCTVIQKVLPNLEKAIVRLCGFVLEEMSTPRLRATVSFSAAQSLPRKIADQIANDITADAEEHPNPGGPTNVRLDSIRWMCEVFLDSAELLHETSSSVSGEGPGWEANSGETPLSRTEAEKVRVELLTACWLGLYFLGIPIANPWEEVLRWADEEGGGLPNGVCVAKAIGDIARDARKLSENLLLQERLLAKAHPLKTQEDGRRDTSAQLVAQPEKPELIVLSGLPILLFRKLLCGPDRSGPTPNEAHVLGRCYELLQFVLYMQNDDKFLYCVRIESVVQTFLFFESERNVPLDREETLKEWEKAIEDLRSLRTKPVRPDMHKVLLLDDPLVPPCFINQDAGLYTFEKLDLPAKRNADAAKPKEMPLPASYMRDIRRKLYIKNLEDDDSGASTNLLEGDVKSHQREFDEVWRHFEQYKLKQR